MPLIREVIASPGAGDQIAVRVDRHTLEKRRWRAVAEDGKDIAVDLEQPCRHGDTLWAEGGSIYMVEQQSESVICIDIPDTPDEAARLGWVLGNQHLPIEIRQGVIYLAYDEPLLEKLKRLHIKGEVMEAVFSLVPHSRGQHHH